MSLPSGVHLVQGHFYILDYTNHRGERAKRVIQYIDTVWDTQELHSEKPGLFIAGMAKDRNWDLRMFAVGGIHGIERSEEVRNVMDDCKLGGIGEPVCIEDLDDEYWT